MVRVCSLSQLSPPPRLAFAFLAPKLTGFNVLPTRTRTGFASMAAVPYAHIVAKILEGKSQKGAVIALAPNPKDIVRQTRSLPPSYLPITLPVICVLTSGNLTCVDLEERHSIRRGPLLRQTYRLPPPFARVRVLYDPALGRVVRCEFVCCASLSLSSRTLPVRATD